MRVLQIVTVVASLLLGSVSCGEDGGGGGGGAAGGTGGAAGSGTGGTGGTASGGAAGTSGTAGSSGSGATGGSAGSGATGGSAGSGATGGSAGGGATGGSAGVGGGSAKYLVKDKAALEALPTTGPAWTYLKARADEALAINLDATAQGSPWLPNYNDSGAGQRLPAKYLAAALVVASSWPGSKQPYRDAVQGALRHVMGSEEEASTDGTADGDRLLATARQLPAWVLAADLIGMDGSLLGTRTKPGSKSQTVWTSTSFATWLSTVITKPIGTHGRWKNIAQTQENSASNWGAHANASRIAVALYRGDSKDLARATQVFRGFLGDSAEYPAYPDGQTPPVGQGFQTTASFDSSWACNYTNTVGGWLPINSAACGAGKNGIVVEDIGRSAAAYPTFDATGIGYSHETMAGLHLAALLLHRQGQPVTSWSDKALLRAMQWLLAQGQLPSSGGSVQHHVPWITNSLYGSSLPTQGAVMGRGLGFTDWLFP